MKLTQQQLSVIPLAVGSAVTSYASNLLPTLPISIHFLLLNKIRSYNRLIFYSSLPISKTFGRMAKHHTKEYLQMILTPDYIDFMLNESIQLSQTFLTDHVDIKSSDHDAIRENVTLLTHNYFHKYYFEILFTLLGNKSYNYTLKRSAIYFRSYVINPNISKHRPVALTGDDSGGTRPKSYYHTTAKNN